MAIDREQICDIAMYGYTHPADTTGLSDAFDSVKDEEAKAAFKDGVLEVKIPHPQAPVRTPRAAPYLDRAADRRGCRSSSR